MLYRKLSVAEVELVKMRKHFGCTENLEMVQRDQ